MENKMYILGYDDHADGNTYLAEEHETSMENVFVAALDVLSRHDNACIIDAENYLQLTHDYYTVAPYAINIGLGIYAKPTNCKQIMNN